MKSRGWLLSLALGLYVAGPGVAAPVRAQSTDAKALRYEVVSVKENKDGKLDMSWEGTPDGIRITGITLNNLLMSAYGLFNSPQGSITGVPKWNETARFNIEARVAPEDVARYKKLNNAEYEAMLLAVLEDRFALKAKPLTVERPVYDLVVVKTGTKLVPAKETLGVDGKPVERSGSYASSSEIRVTDGDLSMLVNNLTEATGRMVIDRTGLSGNYDYALKWTPDAQADAGADTGKAGAPSLFTALQEQLGLKLEPSRGPVKTLVVEHVEMPSAN